MKVLAIDGGGIRGLIPALLLAEIERRTVRRIGVSYATELCRELLDGGAPGLHFYTMNRAAATLEVCANLGWETVSA